MLISEGKLDFNKFKETYKSLKWVRVPRQLGPNHSDFFYVGSLKDKSHTINIQVRPSMRMKVSESFKKYDRNGKELETKNEESLFWFGSTVEVIIDDTVLDKIKKVATHKLDNDKQKVSW